MITLLSRLFIKDRENTSDAGVRRAYGMLCSLVGIGLNVLLFLGKYLAGRLSGSIAMTADAFAEDIQRCLECGMNAHIAKPIDVAELTRLLKKHSRKI